MNPDTAMCLIFLTFLWFLCSANDTKPSESEKSAQVEDFVKYLKNEIELVKEMLEKGIVVKKKKVEQKEETTKKVYEGRPSGFTDRQFVGIVQQEIGTISGLCASRKHPGILYYCHSGGYRNNNKITAIDVNRAAAKVMTITLVDIINNDWQDLACGPCDTEGNGNCIYIPDSGDKGIAPVNAIYKILEPDVITEGSDLSVNLEDMEVIACNSIPVRSQSIMVPPSGRIFLVADYEQSEHVTIVEIINDVPVHVFDVNIPENDILHAADITADGKGLIFRHNDAIYYWYTESEDDYKKVLLDVTLREKLPFTDGGSGRTIAWASDGGSYYTVDDEKNDVLYQCFRID